MTTARSNRTPRDKARDAQAAFALLREDLTDSKLRSMFDKTMETANAVLATITPDSEMASTQALGMYKALVDDTILIARIVAANDRSAMLAAAIITQSGVARPVINPDGE